MQVYRPPQWNTPSLSPTLRILASLWLFLSPEDFSSNQNAGAACPARALSLVFKGHVASSAPCWFTQQIQGVLSLRGAQSI